LKPGRPFKGSSRRVPITIHAPVDLLDVIDEHVEEHATETDTVYSRSDFYNDAAIALLRDRGIEADEEARTQNVPGKSEAKTTGDNINNPSKSGGEKTAQVMPNEPAIKEWE